MDENKGNIIIYQSEDGSIRLDVRLEEKTVWLTQQQMAQLCSIGESGVSRHIANIYKDRELQQETTVAKIATAVNKGL